MPSPLQRFNRFNGAALALATLCFSLASAQETAPLPSPQLTLIGEFRAPADLSLRHSESRSPFGGVSAIDLETAAFTFYALSDDRSEFAPARMYRLAIDLREPSDAGPGGVFGVTIVSEIPLTRDGAPYPPLSVDPEALRWRADGAGFYWAHERDAAGVPFVGEMDLRGATTRSYVLPAYYAPGDGVGVRDNLAFESLTIDHESRIVVATENALVQDGPAADLDNASPSRVLVIDPMSGEPIAEYVYLVDAVAAAPFPPGAFSTNGLVELLTLPEGGFLALERSYSVGRGNTINLYMTDFEGATDVLGTFSIAATEGVASMRKQLVVTLQADDVLPIVDNLEAMSFGPPFGDRRVLVLMSDNNFNPLGQFTQILAFFID